MSYGTLSGGYSTIAKTLHWLVAICVLSVITIGISMGYAPEGPLQNRLFMLHKSFGALILFLMLLRIAYRLIAGAPAPDPTLKTWERTASSAVHGLLYLLVLAMALIGYVGHSAFGAPVPFFGLFELPVIVGKNEPLSEKLFVLHRYLGWAVAAIVALHIAAALQHYFIRRDGVLQRMLPKALGGK